MRKLEQQARSRYTKVQLKGRLSGEPKEQTHPWNMIASKIYIIDMASEQFDTLLRIKDAKSKILAENDDISFQQKILNSRIVFRPKQNGVYRIVATSFQNRGRGDYTVTIREFADLPKQKPKS